MDCETHTDIPTLPGRYCVADYLSLAEGAPLELINGHLVEMPMPHVAHQQALILLIELLIRAARNEGGKTAHRVDVILADNLVVQPDLFYVTQARRGIVRDRVHGAPDLVVEVISPNHARRDRVHKLALYAEHGVAEYWIVDPAEKVFEFLTLVEGKYQVQTPVGDSYTSPVVPEISVNLVDFWGEIDRMLA